MAAEVKAQTELKDFNSLFSLEGKVVVVTGGSRGLGLHAASGYRLPTLPWKEHQTLIMSFPSPASSKPALLKST